MALLQFRPGFGKGLLYPHVHEAMNDIVVGIDESSILRWQVRNRQKKGIQVRYESEQSLLEEEPPSEGEIHQ